MEERERERERLGEDLKERRVKAISPPTRICQPEKNSIILINQGPESTTSPHPTRPKTPDLDI